MEYLLKGKGGIASVGRFGSVLSVRAVESTYRMKVQAESDLVEQKKVSGCPFLASNSKPARAEKSAQAVSLGYDTYLTAGFSTPEKSMVADLGRSPMHRYKRHTEMNGDGKRGKIVCFSSASQRRLMRLVASVERGQPCHFVSLTFPCDVSAPDAKIYLRNFWKRFLRKFEKAGLRVGSIWKMEAQKSGRWHFHLMVFGAKFIPLKWVKWCWADVIRSGGIKGAFDRGVDVRFVNGNMEALKAYVCKYFSKDAGDLVNAYLDENLGRVWGRMGDLPINETVDAGVNVLELNWIWRMLARKTKRNVTKLSPLIFSDCPMLWVDRARSIIKPPDVDIRAGFRQMGVGIAANIGAQIRARTERARKRDVEFSMKRGELLLF